MSGFLDAAREAASFRAAVENALAVLCERLGARSGILFESMSAGYLEAVARFPAGEADPVTLPSDGFLVKRFAFYDAALPISEDDLQTWARWAAEQRPAYVAEMETLARIAPRLAIALKRRKETIGLLLVGAPEDEREYTASERRLARAAADQLALMLENAKLTERVLEQEKLNRDLALAAEVQKRLLPDTCPETELGELGAFTLPARSVGGDYYDFIRVGDREVGIALADVAGKGVPAALIMSVVQASLRILATESGGSLPQMVAKMNRFLHRATGVSSYATFFYAQLDEANRELRYVNAGHNPPVLIRRQEDGMLLEELGTGGMIIGMFAQAQYEEARLEVRAGDVLFAFTDGVTEALNTAGEEFGDERLRKLLQDVVEMPVNEMATRISGELRNWIGTAPQHDDITFVILKVR